MVPARGGQQLRQTPRLGLRPAQPILGRARDGTGVAFGAGAVGPVRLGRLHLGASGGQGGLRRFQRSLRLFDLERSGGADGFALAPGGRVLSLQAGRPSLRLLAAASLGAQAGLGRRRR